LLFFFMAGLLLHFECASIGSLSHPAGDRPSHSISEKRFAFFGERTATVQGSQEVIADEISASSFSDRGEEPVVRL
jgi:hypothetical protein